MTREEWAPALERVPEEVPECALQGVAEDSRRVQPGYLFVASVGVRHDGHDYAEQAARQGAVAIAGAREGVTELAGLPYVYTPHPRRALGRLAQRLAGDPTRALTVVGITGTNGKTSVALLLQAILRAAGHEAANFGTIAYDLGREQRPAPLTTPFGEDLAELFRAARDGGATHVSMEVSSHALDQERVAGVHFAAGAFTNLTQDHLDYHGTMENYRAAKLRLFGLLDADRGLAVVNADDPHAQHFLDAAPRNRLTFGAEGHVRAVDVYPTFRETRFTLQSPWGEAGLYFRLLGRHNVSNALCAAALAGGLGVPFDAILSGLHDFTAVPGRFEEVARQQPFQVIVDYAHTDDALRNVHAAAREVADHRIITVFGCGGDRDRGKRPLMAKAVAEGADYAILTSDNPRTESPQQILQDTEAGLVQAGWQRGREYALIEDRRAAIYEAIQRANNGDVVLIAGKGHEDYQIVGTERRAFDDRAVAREALRERGA